uniref:Putative secreted protein n=1 Tax=Anopheles darlingi TaxID=43151 RepID=A0A2M4D2W6_ANODA
MEPFERFSLPLLLMFVPVVDWLLLIETQCMLVRAKRPGVPRCRWSFDNSDISDSWWQRSLCWSAPATDAVAAGSPAIPPWPTEAAVPKLIPAPMQVMLFELNLNDPAPVTP